MSEQPDLTAWIGRSETAEERLAPEPVEALAAVFDRPLPARTGDDVPGMWHWVYFLPRVPQSELGRDGHPERGGFMPPVDLPRRMFAGCRTTFHRPLRVGETVRRTATIRSVEEKEGRSGPLIFVTVRYEYAGEGGTVAVREDQDIVYRGEGGGGSGRTGQRSVPTLAWHEPFVPDPVLLFRFSAVTFNAHRIHYDRPYATGTEGYPDLVVHGPLLALRLLELERRNRPADAELTGFSFRARAPLFAGTEVVLVGEPAEESGATMAAYSVPGTLAMTAEVSYGIRAAAT